MTAGPFPGLAGALERARAALRHAECRTVLEHWASLAAAGYPRRDALDPLAMPRALPLIWMLAYDPDRRRFIYRLTGEVIRDSYDRPLVGMALDEVVPARDYARVERYFLDCVRKPAIVVVTGRLYEERERPGAGDRVILPLFDAAGRPSGLLGCTYVEHLFTTRREAFDAATRRILTLPLDGGEPSLLEY